MLACSLLFMKTKLSVASAWLDGDARRDAHLWGDSLLGLTNRPNDNSRDGQRINALRDTVHAIIYKVHLSITCQKFIRAGEGQTPTDTACEDSYKLVWEQKQDCCASRVQQVCFEKHCREDACVIWATND